MASLFPITIPMTPPSIPYESEPKSTPKLFSFFLKAIVITIFLTFFLVVLAFALFLVLVLCLLRGLLRRLHLRIVTETLGANNDSLFHFRVDKGTRPEPDDAQCVVCLEGFQNGECCRKLVRYGHVFHSTCVEAWLVRVAACPTCRTPVRLSSLVGAETEDEGDCQLWLSALNDINGFIALNLHFLAYRLCRIIFAPSF